MGRAAEVDGGIDEALLIHDERQTFSPNSTLRCLFTL